MNTPEHEKRQTHQRLNLEDGPEAFAVDAGSKLLARKSVQTSAMLLAVPRIEPRVSGRFIERRRHYRLFVAVTAMFQNVSMLRQSRGSIRPFTSVLRAACG